MKRRYLIRIAHVATIVVTVHFLYQAAQKQWLGWWRPRDWAHNLTRALKRHPPDIPNAFDPIGDIFRKVRVSGATFITVPAQYDEELSNWGNAGYAFGRTSYADVHFKSAPYPHPKLLITQDVPGGNSYSFDNRPFNAALQVTVKHQLWPLGYSAWLDLVTTPRKFSVPTPILMTADGRLLPPKQVHAVHPANEAHLRGDRTDITEWHYSPIVWDFDAPGSLGGLWQYALSADGKQVSWMPALPTENDVIGVFLLQDLIAHPAEPAPAPAWWALDEALRRRVVAGADPVETQRLVAELAKQYPSHPLLEHYRVVAALHGSSFTQRWKAAQTKECQLSTWYLLPWTELSRRDVESLTCMRYHDDHPMDPTAEYILGAVLLKFRDDHSEPMRRIAQDLVGRSGLPRDPNGFNYVTTDFAYLWLRSQ